MCISTVLTVLHDNEPSKVWSVKNRFECYTTIELNQLLISSSPRASLFWSFEPLYPSLIKYVLRLGCFYNFNNTAYLHGI